MCKRLWDILIIILCYNAAEKIDNEITKGFEMGCSPYILHNIVLCDTDVVKDITMIYSHEMLQKDGNAYCLKLCYYNSPDLIGDQVRFYTRDMFSTSLSSSI